MSTRRSTKNRIAFSRFMTSAAVAGLLMMGSAVADDTLPTGGNIVAGSGKIGTPHDGKLDINQTSSRMVTDWNSFDIGPNNSVQFYQPSASSLAVNRVTSGDPVKILGELKANGQVMVLDRNGVLFGTGSRIDTGGIIASTGDIANDAVMQGNGKLSLSNFGPGSVVNQGTIKVADTGLVALVAPNVSNSGVINAKLGRVALAGGKGTATVDLYGDGLVELASPSVGKASATNTGAINANGGNILITARAANEIVSNVVNMDKAVNANSVKVSGDSIVLGTSDNAGVVNVQGSTGGNLKLQGGTVNVTGDTTMNGGRLTVDAATVNTNGRIADANGVLAKPVSTNAQTVNVQSDKASAQQGVDLAGDATVNIAAGTYHENLVVDKDDITINGAHKGEASGSPTRFVNETNIVGDGSNKDIVTIQGNRDTLDGLSLVNGGNGVRVGHVTGATIKNTLIQHQSGSNIRAIGATDLTASGNFMRVAESGIVVEHGKGTTTLAGNSISAEKLNGIYAEDTAGLDINHNHVAQGVEGINVKTSTGAQIAHNAVEHQTLNGISVEDTLGARLRYNRADDQANDSFHVVGSDNTTFEGNRAYTSLRGYNVIGSNGLVMTGNFAGTDNDGVSKGANNVAVGIRVSGSKDGQLYDNTIKSASQLGIYLVNDYNFQVGKIDPTNSMHYSNKIDGARTGILANYGGDIAVAKNLIDHTTAEGVQLNSVQGKSDIDHNHIMHGFQGILASNDPNLIVGHNVVEHMKDDGVRLFNDNGARVVSNRIDDLGTVMTTVTPGSGTTITTTPGVVSESGLDGNGGANQSGSVTVTMGSPATTTTTRTGGNGIVVQSSNGVTVDVNRIYNVGLDGVQANNTKGLTVVNNFVGSDLDGVSKGAVNVGRNGVNVQNSDGSTIIGNSIMDVATNGIRADNDTNARIGQGTGDTKFSNTIDRAQTGINVTNGTNVTVQRNLIDNTSGNGIDGAQVIGFNVDRNRVMHGQTGINVDGMANVDIGHNITTGMRADGINVDHADGSAIHDNTAGDTNGNGIVVTNSTNAGVTANNVYNTTADGIFAIYADGLTLAGNKIGYDQYGTYRGNANIQGYGIALHRINGVGLDGNTVAGALGKGIVMERIDNANLTNNDVKNNGEIGLLAYGGSNGAMTLAGNHFSAEPVGVDIESGRIDLTGASNTFDGNGTGLKLVSGNVSLVNDTLGTTAFHNIGRYYIDLRKGALYQPGMPTQIGAANVQFDAYTGKMAPATIQLKIHDYLSDPTLGRINRVKM